MRQILGTLLVGLLATSIAQGHFAFIVPEPDGATAKVIFSDNLKPDTQVNIEKIAATKLTLRDAAGKESPLTWTKGEGCYVVNLPGSGPRVVYGVTEYGVRQTGADVKPFRLVYYPKALIGNVPANAAALGDKVNLEIVPYGEPGKTRFRVLSAGKPAADVEVSIFLPGKEMKSDKAVKTDKDGFTPAYEAIGRYGVYARLTVAKPGEYAGKKYEETRNYATLVVDIGKGQ